MTQPAANKSQSASRAGVSSMFQISMGMGCQNRISRNRAAFAMCT